MAELKTQFEFDLDFEFEKGEARLVHPQISQFGFFATVVRDPVRAQARARQMRLDGKPDDVIARKGSVFQQMHRVERMPYVLDRLDPRKDTWISQAQFGLPPARPGEKRRIPNRRAVNATRVQLCFVDLDCRDLTSAKAVDQRIRDVLAFCAASEIPPPSFVVFSGRGLHLKWILTLPVSRSDLPLWNDVQDGLVRAFAATSWNIDLCAKDVSRVLRVENTINTKSGQICRVAWCDTSNGEVPQVPFADLQARFTTAKTPKKLTKAEEAVIAEAMQEEWATYEIIESGDDAAIEAFFPAPRLEIIRRANPVGVPRGLHPMKLAWDRLADIRALAQMRADRYFAGDLKGRENNVFWGVNFSLLSGIVHPGQIMREALEIARQVGGNEWAQGKHWGDMMSTLKRRAVTDRKLIYTPKNDTLIDLLEITSDEQQSLKTIISYDEKRRRARPKENERKEGQRREAGKPTRAEYTATADEARRLIAQGIKNVEIARITGLSPQRVGQIRKKSK